MEPAADVLTELFRTPVTNRAVTISEAMTDLDQQIASGDYRRFRPMGTGFEPLDEVLNGGLRSGEMMILGGPFGVGKTIFALQVARNAALLSPSTYVVYVCYEHNPSELLLRLLCLESADGLRQGEALTLRALTKMTNGDSLGKGLISEIRKIKRFGPAIERMEEYGPRLALIRASGHTGSLERIASWVDDVVEEGRRVLLVVDYLQKIPLGTSEATTEDEASVAIAQGMKELALQKGIAVIGIAASDRAGLKATRMRLVDLRGGSAFQYECDIGVVLNNKYSIVSREHLVYNVVQGSEARNWIVLSIEKNRAGVNAVDMEFELQAAHFRINPQGRFVRERLVDDRVVMS
jgi:replicative DNA helicase